MATAEGPRQETEVVDRMDAGSSGGEDDDDDLEVKKIKKKKISAIGLQLSDGEDDGDVLESKKIKKKKISAIRLRMSDGEDDDDDLEAKKIKKKKISAIGLHISHEKDKPERRWRIKLKPKRPIPRESDERKEEREKIKEALQKRCVVKIEKTAAILLKRAAFAASESPGEVSCPYCGRTFKTVGGMKVHRTRIHIQKEGHLPWCDSCRQVFQDVKKLNQHSKRCAGIRKNVPGTREPLMLQRTAAGILVPSPGHLRHLTPQGKQPGLEESPRLDQGGLPAAVPKYQFLMSDTAQASPMKEAAAEEEKCIGFSREECEAAVQSVARSPRKKSLRPRKVSKLPDESSRENKEWEGAHSSFEQVGERRVQPSRRAKSAVESYCECSKSSPEDSQDGETEKTPGEGCSGHDTTSNGDDAQHDGPSRDRKWTSAASGAQNSDCSSTAKKWQFQTDGEHRGLAAISSRVKKNETIKSRPTLLVHPIHTSASPVGDSRRASVIGGEMKSRVPQAGSNVPNWDDAKLMVQRNCLPVTEMVRMLMIPSGRRSEPDRQEAAAMYGENLVTTGAVGAYKSTNKQSLSQQVSHPNTDSNKSEDETESLFEKLQLDDGEHHSHLNSTHEMNSLESEEHNNLTCNTTSSSSCQKRSPMTVGKDDTSTLLGRNMYSIPLNLSAHTSADESASNEPSNLNKTSAALPIDVDNDELSGKSASGPQNRNSPHSSNGQQVDGHLHNPAGDVIQPDKDVHEKGIAPTDSVRDTALDLRKVTVKSHTGPAGTQEVLNLISAATSSKGASSDFGETWDSPMVEASVQPASEDGIETEAADSVAKSPSQFSEAGASADDEASDGSKTETCDELYQVWSPDQQSNTGGRLSAMLSSNCLVSSTTSVTAKYNNSPSRSEMCENRDDSQDTGTTDEPEASRRHWPSSERSITINTLRMSPVPSPTAAVTNGRVHSGPAEMGIRLQTADSTTEDPVLEESEVTHPPSVTQRPRVETSQSQPVGRNIVEDVEIHEVNYECPNNTLKEENPSKLTATSEGNVTSTPDYPLNHPKGDKETEKQKESQEATLTCLEIMKKMLETIPKPPQSPAQIRATQTEDHIVCNSEGTGKTAEAPTQSSEFVSFFLAPITTAVPRAPTPRLITVAKDLSEYESSSCSSFAEHIMKTHDIDSSPAAVEIDEGSSQRNSRIDLGSERLRRSSLTDGGSVLSNGSAQSCLPGTPPISERSNHSSGTLETVTNSVMPAGGITLGTNPRVKVGKDARNVKRSGGAPTTADSWLAATPLPYSIQKVLCNPPSSPATQVSPLSVYVNRNVGSPLSTQVALDSIRRPQDDLGSEVKSESQTVERRSSPRPLDDGEGSRGVSEPKLPPFATLAKSLAEVERPNRPYSLPAGVKMELTKIKHNNNKTLKLVAKATKYVNDSLSAGNENTQSDIQRNPSSKLAECSSPKDEELYILYEHRPKAINSSLQDRPYSAPLAKSDQKSIGRFHPKFDTVSHQKGTLMMPSVADRYVSQKQTVPRGVLGSESSQGLRTAAIHPYSQQPQPALWSGSPSIVSLPNPSDHTPKHTPRKGESPRQDVAPAPWPALEISQVYQQNKTGSGATMHEVILHSTLNNSLSATTNTCKNIPQADVKDISLVAAQEVKMLHSTWKAPNQTTIAQGGQSTLPNLPDIIGFRIANSIPGKPADTVGNKQAERNSGDIPADGQAMRGAGSGRRGRGGRRAPPSRDDLQPCECPCGKVCKNYRGLEQHKARVHRDIVFFRGDGGNSCSSWPHVLSARSFDCPCGARFGRLDAIRKHFAAEQAEAGERRWWISDRVPICVCRHSSRMHNYKVPPLPLNCLQSYCGASQMTQPMSSNVFSQETWPGTTLQHQSTPGGSERSQYSDLEACGSSVTDLPRLRNLLTDSCGGVPGLHSSDSYPPGLWNPPFPVSRLPSQSAVRVMKSAQATAQHYTYQNSASGWWSSAAGAKNCAAQMSSAIQVVASMQESSNVTRNTVEQYSLASDAGGEFQHTMASLFPRPREMASTTTGTSANKLPQFSTGGPTGWSHKYGSQSTDSNWTLPAAPHGGSGAFSTWQQHDRPTSDRGSDHTSRITPQLQLADQTLSQNTVAREGQQQSDLDRPAACGSLSNVFGNCRPELQQCNAQQPRSLALLSTAQPKPKPKLPSTHQEFSSTHQNVPPFHWGAGMLPPSSAANGGSIVSVTSGHPSQSLARPTLGQSRHLGAGTGFEVAPQLAHTPTSDAQGCYSSGILTKTACKEEREHLVDVSED